MIKIKSTCSWETSEKITDRLLSQFVTNENDLKDIMFVHDDSYDVMVIFGYITEMSTNNRPMYLFPQEPRWSGGHQRYFNNVENLTVYGFEKTIYQPNNIVIETVAHMFYGGIGDDSNTWTYDNIKNYDFTKTKGISSFVSNRGLDHVEFSPDCLYPDRLELVKQLTNNLGCVDFYGGWENKITNQTLNAPKKFEKLKDYKFSLAVENSHEKYYISEKFYDCILTNTIPIYYGCINIKDYWPENGYILLNDIKDYKSVISKINEINNNLDDVYNEMLPELLKMKERYFNEFNTIKKIKQITHGNIDR